MTLLHKLKKILSLAGYIVGTWLKKLITYFSLQDMTKYYSQKVEKKVYNFPWSFVEYEN